MAPSELRYGISLLRNVSISLSLPLLENSTSPKVTSCFCAPQGVPVAIEEPDSTLLKHSRESALQQQKAGRSVCGWVGGVCVTQQGCCSALFPLWEVNLSVGFVFVRLWGRQSRSRASGGVIFRTQHQTFLYALRLSML